MAEGRIEVELTYGWSVVYIAIGAVIYVGRDRRNRDEEGGGCGCGESSSHVHLSVPLSVNCSLLGG